jgi:hypothetical protein
MIIAPPTANTATHLVDRFMFPSFVDMYHVSHG